MADTTNISRYHNHGSLPVEHSAVQPHQVTPDEVIHTVVVHRFGVSDVDDPDLHAARPLWDWQNSPVGQWVMQNSVEIPTWSRHLNHHTYGYDYSITARLADRAYVYYLLRWT